MPFATLRVVSATPDHDAALVALARRVRHTDRAYPPFDVPDTDDGLAAWLAEDAYHRRWVAETDAADGRDDGAASVVLGHVGLVAPHAYLTEHLAAHPAGNGVDPATVWEVSKLFVSPAARGLGLGARLLEGALSEAARCGHVPALAVLDASVAARCLYERLGMRPAGAFTGRHGLNHVYVG